MSIWCNSVNILSAHYREDEVSNVSPPISYPRRNPHVSAVTPWRHTDAPCEGLGEMTLVRETTFECDLRQRKGLICEKLLRNHDTSVLKPLIRRNTDSVRKRPDEMIVGQPAGTSYLHHRNPVGKPERHQLGGSPQLPIGQLRAVSVRCGGAGPQKYAAAMTTSKGLCSGPRERSATTTSPHATPAAPQLGYRRCSCGGSFTP